MIDLHVFWLILGCVCLLLEFVIPGGLVGTLGVCAVIIHGMIRFQLISGWTQAFLYWMLASTMGLFITAFFFSRFISGESKVQNADPESEFEGAIVTVSERVSPEKTGRIQFRDTTWQAYSDEVVEKGSKAIIIAQDGNLFKIRSL